MTDQRESADQQNRADLAVVDGEMNAVRRQFLVTLSTSIGVASLLALALHQNDARFFNSSLLFEGKSLSDETDRAQVAAASLATHAWLMAVVLPLYLATQLRAVPHPGDPKAQVRAYLLDAMTAVSCFIAAVWSAIQLVTNFTQHQMVDYAAVAGFVLFASLGALCRTGEGPVHVARLELNIKALDTALEAQNVDEWKKAKDREALTEEVFETLTRTMLKEGDPVARSDATELPQKHRKLVRRQWWRWFGAFLGVAAVQFLLFEVAKVITPSDFEWSWWLVIASGAQSVFALMTAGFWLERQAARATRRISSQVTPTAMTIGVLALELIILISAGEAALNLGKSATTAWIAWGTCAVSVLIVVYPAPRMISSRRCGQVHLRSLMLRQLVQLRRQLEAAQLQEATSLTQDQESTRRWGLFSQLRRSHR